MAVRSPHGHPLGFKKDCPQCKADRARIRAKKRAKAEAEEVAKQARQERMTPAYRAYRATQRRDERATRFAGVIALPSAAQSGAGAIQIGPNEAATIAQCELLPKSEVNPAAVQHARQLSTILDNPAMAAIWSRTARDIQALLLPLDAPKKKSRSRLSAVISMTERKRAAQ
jgi:hypothetical protein